MTVNLDRFAQGTPDPADAKIMAECQGCGGEIYEGEDVYVLDDGSITHGDWECLYRYLDPQYMAVEEALGVK